MKPELNKFLHQNRLDLGPIKKNDATLKIPPLKQRNFVDTGCCSLSIKGTYDEHGYTKRITLALIK